MRKFSLENRSHAECGLAPSLAAPVTGTGGETLYVALLSGFLGIASALHFANWQVSVESAQVLAETVKYPYDSSFHTYHLKCWTLLNQLPALALAAGLPANTTSLIVASLSGILGFQALACLALALGANRWLAITTPLVYLAIEVIWEQACPVYPLKFINTPHTYGSFALSGMLLALALLGRGHVRCGWFLLALGPAVHLALGAWGLLIAGVGTALDGSRIRSTLAVVWPWALLATAIGLVSFGWQYTVWWALPEVTPEARERYMALSYELGDTHRAVVPAFALGVVINLCFLVAATLWLGPLRGDLPDRAGVLLASLAASGLLAVAACWLTPWQSELPELFLRAMPGRFANLVILAFPAVMVGLIGAYWEHLIVRAIWVFIAAMLVAVMFGGYYAVVWTLILGCTALLAALRLLSPGTLGVFLELLAVGCLLSLSVRFTVGPEALMTVCLFGFGEFVWRRFSVSSNSRRAAILALLALVALLGFHTVAQNGRQGGTNLSPDIALHKAAQGYGMLLTGSDLFLVQLKTGRPVLFCGGAVDMLPYVPEAGPDAQRVLAEVYGIDLLDPNRTQLTMTGNVLQPDAARTLWQRRSEIEWRQIRKKFQVTDVLVYRDWKLNLPLVAESAELRLYRIP
jgi:hypothetical protein